MDGRTKGAAELVGGSVKGSNFGGAFTLLLVYVKRDIAPSSTSVEVSDSIL